MHTPGIHIIISNNVCFVQDLYGYVYDEKLYLKNNKKCEYRMYYRNNMHYSQKETP